MTYLICRVRIDLRMYLLKIYLSQDDCIDVKASKDALDVRRSHCRLHRAQT